jgi:hypothetical protein
MLMQLQRGKRRLINTYKTCEGAALRNGQLGDDLVAPPASWLTPQTSPGFCNLGAMSIHAGGASTCVINGFGSRRCAGTSQAGQLAKATPATPAINTSPVPTVIPTAVAPAFFAVPAAFATFSDAGGNPLYAFALSVRN